MKTRNLIGLVGTTVAGAVFFSACGGTSTTCGEGTTRDGSKCVASGDGSGGASGSGGGSAGQAGSGGSAGGPVAQNDPPDFAGVDAVAPATETALLVAWQPASDDTSAPEDIRYNIYVANEDGMQNFGAPQAEAPPGATSLILTNLTPNVEQFVVVRAVDADGNEEENTHQVSNEPGFDTGAPDFGGVVSAEPAGPAAATVRWDAASDDRSAPGAISYLVYWSDTEGQAIDGTLGVMTAPGVTEVEVKGLKFADADFFFSVRAVDAAGNVDQADPVAEVGGRSGADMVPPVFAGCRGVSSPTASGMHVEWDMARDDVTKPENMRYRVYAEQGELRVGDPLGAFQEFTGVTAVDIVGLQPTSAYSIVCRAVDEADNEDDNFVTRLATTLSDDIPPTFGGITMATVGSTDADLSWDPATDDQSLPADIRYNVYQSLNSTFNFDAPPFANTAPGEVAIRLDGLDPNVEYFWVVRAEDEAGNEDTNTQTLNRTTFVSFALNVQPIWTVNCAVAGCHVPGNPPQGLVLSEGFAYSNVVDVPAVGSPGKLRVDSSNSDPLRSLIVRKDGDMLEMDDGGGKMPPEPRTPISSAELDTIMAWIAQGALDN